MTFKGPTQFIPQGDGTYKAMRTPWDMQQMEYWKNPNKLFTTKTTEQYQTGYKPHQVPVNTPDGNVDFVEQPYEALMPTGSLRHQDMENPYTEESLQRSLNMIPQPGKNEYDKKIEKIQGERDWDLTSFTAFVDGLWGHNITQAHAGSLDRRSKERMNKVNNLTRLSAKQDQYNQNKYAALKEHMRKKYEVDKYNHDKRFQVDKANLDRADRFDINNHNNKQTSAREAIRLQNRLIADRESRKQAMAEWAQKFNAGEAAKAAASGRKTIQETKKPGHALLKDQFDKKNKDKKDDFVLNSSNVEKGWKTIFKPADGDISDMGKNYRSKVNSYNAKLKALEKRGILAGYNKWREGKGLEPILPYPDVETAMYAEHDKQLGRSKIGGVSLKDIRNDKETNHSYTSLWSKGMIDFHKYADQQIKEMDDLLGSGNSDYKDFLETFNDGED